MIDYTSVLSRTVTGLKKSGIRKFFDLLDGRKDVIGLTVGQPDFVTPWHIREAGIESLQKGKTYYTSNAGMPELRAEICTYLKRRFALSYMPEETVVTVGGSEAIDLAIRAVTDPGDEIIIPTPSFVCYEPIARLCGGVPVIVKTTVEDRFKLTPEALRAAITPKTKMLVLPYPNNPTGAILTKEELEGIAEVLRGTNILVLSDEIYAEMTYGRQHVSIASLDGMWERTIITSGFSKSYAMTGWRMGYLAAPKPLAEQMLKIHQYAIMCAPTTSQLAAIEALKNGDEDIAMMVGEYDRRRRFVYQGFRDIGIDVFEPEGAFYIYPEVGKFGLDAETFCDRLLNEYKCAIVPGTAFGEGGERFARVSYAYSIKHIEEALNRIEAFVKTLK
ncbi:MAG: aminotransferase class I/II-fold pyridoxal phosphate-dependent enzyme [Ruminococcaceae bacterium]|nr:aminotransferase class I/II-fold pyridoxal phosphate-dependent enzyme [Oscillospiraceae bacterium]MBR2312542.1 aminotransferase class I/II-fold pyridoxal phosphate-dependent enzyme [Clostridia bacterium]MBR2464112.1 aminotransferase class I/II-fold pyridoxal phosphate-dependent enzyme [Clostridia bacterium]MBR3862265.1 aminotransferase class I/II-fold pyridoxal phosphate-dependent enzyme [Clostridia bacterium]